MKRNTRLLVSVRSASEARAALAGGVQILDVKEPSGGSLGMAEPAVWHEVVEAAGGRVPVTVALGELAHWTERAAPCGEHSPSAIHLDQDDPPALCSHLQQIAFQLPPAVWLLKVGLAGCQGTRWQQVWCALRDGFTRCDSRPAQAVPAGWVAVAYADWERAAAPGPSEVARFAAEQSCAAFLVDTWQKDGTTLLDWLSREQLAALIDPLRRRGLVCALAGSLRPPHIRRVLPLQPDVIAVRGAVCRHRRRDSTIDARAVRTIAELVGPSTRSPIRRAVAQRDL